MQAEGKEAKGEAAESIAERGRRTENVRSNSMGS